ncbi:hypothetical protein WR25_04996 isoform A [Diploscapter pachys]|uniref:RING-type domain-containing protein n=2 Tax=Diploscapter pachys TaxID=2018661 RepID=A0A2A2J4W3_9BILA|nr:hypothetical protein WR25_04996 isoform A [Diploscapter pachys]
MSMQRFGKGVAKIFQELFTRYWHGKSYTLFSRIAPQVFPNFYRLDVAVQKLPPIPRSRILRFFRVALRGNRGFRPFSSLSAIRKDHDNRHNFNNFRSRVHDPKKNKANIFDRVRHTFQTNTRYNRDLINFEWPTVINSYEFGSNIDYGGNAAVYSARLRDLDVRRALTGNFQGVLNSNEDNLKAYPLAIKLMYNYQHNLSQNDDHLWRDMGAELVPLPDSYKILKGKLGSFKPLPGKHPNVVRMHTAFIDRMPLLDDARERYPEALPTASFYREFINPEPRTMFLIMKRYRMTLHNYVLTHRRGALTCKVMVGQLLEGVVYLYDHCIAHRDMKSDNILLEFDDYEDVPHLVISDFGCALANGSWTVKYRDDTIDLGGNLSMRAPEIKTAKPGPDSIVDFRMADTWAAGGLSYEILTKVNPFYKQLKSENYSEEDLPPLPRKAGPEMQNTIKDLLRRDPNHRIMPHIAANVLTLSLFRFGTNFPSTLNDCGLGQFNFEFWRQTVGRTMNKWKKAVSKSIDDLVALIAAETVAARAIVPQAMSPAELQLRATFLSRIQREEMLQAITYFINSEEKILILEKMLFISCPDFSNRMHNFYVPLVIRLELKEGAEQVFFEEVSQTSNTKSLPSPPRQRRRLVSGMKKRSPPVDSAPPPTTTGKEQGKEHKHYGPTAANPNAARSEKEHSQSSIDQKGKRTYSEVVVETLEGDKLRPLIERNPAEQSQTRSRTPSSRAQSEPGGDSEYLSYYYGNPLLEKTEGLLHFYKYSDESLVAETQCRMLCMLAVPAHISTRDLITFIGPAIDQIERFRIVRDSTPNQYSVIIKFKKHYDAVVFYEEYNGMQFDNLDTHKCTLLYVDKIESLTSNQMADVREDDRLVELPTCACCLERLDDGVVSILCNHTFHAECLQKWSDITCPVCRYIQTPELVAEQRCSDCGQSSDLWICLICGNIGCGRYAEAHAQRHFEMTSHTFCLQVGGDRVWDYAGDNYVHRLIQSGEDGKLVEYNRGMDSIDGDKKNEELAMEYTCLLTSQLEDQRKYFEVNLIFFF